MIVSEVMSPNPVTISLPATLDAAVDLMNQNRIRHLPVLDHGHLVGILSDRDVRYGRPNPRARIQTLKAMVRFSTTPVSEVMTRPVHTVRPDMAVKDVADIMLAHKIGGIPVVEDETVVGIVTDTDLLRLLTHVLEERAPIPVRAR